MPGCARIVPDEYRHHQRPPQVCPPCGPAVLVVSRDVDILSALERAFSTAPRPVHFTDFAHCAECTEHDERLQACAREALHLEDVGYAAFDPFCVALPESFAYFLPSLARLALAPPSAEHGWYGTQLLFHLMAERHGNGFYRICTSAQRQAVARFLRHLLETRASLVEADCATHALTDCYSLWSTAPSLRVLN